MSSKNNFLSTYFFILLILSFLLLSKIYLQSGIILSQDLLFTFNLNSYIHQFYPLWNEYGSYSTLTSVIQIFPAAIFYITSSLLKLSAASASKILFLGAFFTIGISMYYAMSRFLSELLNEKSNTIIFFSSALSSIIYLLNFWSLDRIVHYWIWVSYGIFPIAIFFSLKLFSDKKKDKRVIISLSIAMFLSSVSYPYIIFNALIICAFLYFGVVNFEKNIFIKNTKTIFSVFSLYALLISIWLVPLLFSMTNMNLGREDVLGNEVVDLLSRESSFSNGFRLLGYWWPQVAYNSDIYDPIWIGSTFLLPIIVIFTLIICPKNKYVIFFSIIASVSLLLSIGTKSLFPSLSLWLVLKVPLGWILREPNKIMALLSLSYAFLAGIFIHALHKRINSTRYTSVICLVIVSVFLYSIWPTATAYFHDIYNPIDVPKEYDAVTNWLQKDTTDFKITWMPEYSGISTLWTNHSIGLVDILSSSNPTVSSIKTLPGYYNTYINYLLIQNRSSSIYKFFSILGTKYIIFHKDIPSLDDTSNILLNTIANQRNIVFSKENGFITIYENPFYIKPVSTTSFNIFVSGGIDKYTSLSNVPDFTPSDHGVIFLQQKLKSVIINNNESIFIFKNANNLLSISDNYFISPFESTPRMLPSEFWSKNNIYQVTWHEHLKERNIQNWDFDYGTGLIFTWSNSIIDAKVNPSKKDLLDAYDFENGSEGWDINAKDIQSMESSSDTHSGEQSIQLTLTESNWGWKTANSPLIPVGYSTPYRWIFYIKGENAEGVHAKIIAYDIDKQILSGKQVASIGTGTFDWKEVSFDYKPTDKRVAYMQLQIWHGHETKQPLPNKVWIDDVKVYDLTKYIQPVTLDMDVNVENDGTYELFVRYFKNKDGGRIDLSMDGETIRRINTYDQLNKFVWEKVSTLNLKKGKHKLTLTNADGFNAVNIFALIPEKEYQQMEAKTESLLEGKRLMYVLEAESDIYRSDANISKKYGGDASNGEVLEFNKTSKAWQKISITRADNYTMAIKMSGDLNVKIDEKNYAVSSETPEFRYIGPIYLEKGDHNIEITPKSSVSDLDVVWLYSTDEANETLDDVFTVNETPATVTNYTKINPTLYKIKVDAEKPFMLAFAESYDPLWYARVAKSSSPQVSASALQDLKTWRPGDQEKVRPVPLYSVINGFWINQTGDLEITIEYEPQKWFYVGAAISITTLIACISYLIYDWRRNRRPQDPRREHGKTLKSILPTQEKTRRLKSWNSEWKPVRGTHEPIIDIPSHNDIRQRITNKFRDSSDYVSDNVRDIARKLKDWAAALRGYHYKGKAA